MSGDFFPYHPLRLRLWLLGASLVALALVVVRLVAPVVAVALRPGVLTGSTTIKTG